MDHDLSLIEEAMDDCDSDIDAELNGSVLTLSCENGSAVVFSRQTATRELWMAARSGGYHFRLEDDRWCCTRSSVPLRELFTQVMQEQAGETIRVDI